MKKFCFSFFALFSMILIFQASCVNLDPVGEETEGTDIRIPQGYLESALCNEFHEGASRDIEVEVTIDGIDDQGDPVFIGLDIEETDNEDYEAFIIKDVEVPTQGTYIVTVTIRGLSSCFSCCHNTTINDEFPCDSPDNGKIRFRGTSAIINAVPPPFEITVVPSFVACTNCGC